MTSVNIRFSDNQTGKGSNVNVNPQQDVGQAGYLTSIELRDNRQGITVIVKHNGQQIAKATENDNSKTFTRTAINELVVVVTRA
ncbi:hypothetical protein LTR70_003889 [Exophiala xenobiotica]|uniref:Uncharacterized protein n=1 Tax=Lithohypha guttulata TaxID=1690604 RepID=A0ABR0KGG8_9EURO|nr:hypothetical protein LTR24_003421 [Lithohypha guttulata]KAK5322208.1 hypothetical protein LTR70_003889 [Exophiala xenobiotica]